MSRAGAILWGLAPRPRHRCRSARRHRRRRRLDLHPSRRRPGPSMAVGVMPMPWTLTTFRVMLVMWIVMMTAMMLPNAAPMILLLRRSTGDDRQAARRTRPAFSPSPIGRLWAAFSIVATGAQMGTGTCQAGVCDHGNRQHRPGGTVFLLAGVYQLTPLKQVCLRRCRSPLEFLSHHWQGGAFGAFGWGCGMVFFASAAAGP